MTQVVEPTIDPEFVYRHSVDTRADIYVMRTLLTVLFRRLGTPDLLDECLAEVDRQVPPPRSDLMGADMRVTVKRRVDELFDQLGG